MNGSTGIQPTVELATTNGNGFGYPVVPMFGNYGNNNGFFGSEGIWAIVLIALLFGGNGWNGFGGGNGWNNIATTDYISSEFTQRDINNGFQNQNNLISNGFSNTAQDICNLRSEVLENRYANQLAESNTQRDILLSSSRLENDLATQSLQGFARLDSCCCELKAQGLENTQRILDAMNQNTIQDLRDRLTQAKDIISDQRTENNIISALRPYPIPAYLTSSPYVGFGYGWGNGNFYGNGFYGNTII